MIGQTVVVTGASGGIDRAVARAYGARHAKVALARRRRAEKAGRDWATSLIPSTEQAAATPDDPAQRITELFADMNFDLELGDPAPGTGERQIRLRACPYRDVAPDHPEVVCASHLGHVHGVIAQLGGPPTSVRLVPFVWPPPRERH